MEAAVAAGMTAVGFVGGSHCRPGYVGRLRATARALVVEAMAELLPGVAASPSRLP